MSKRDYTCDHCGRPYLSDWDDEEAIAEYERDYGPFNPALVVELCDDCYKLFKGFEEERL